MRYMDRPADDTNALEEALRENRDEARSLVVDEEANKEASARLGIGVNPAGTWGKKNKLHFKAYYDPPHFGSIHYWLAYGREVLTETRSRRAHVSEVRCAIEGLKRFATQQNVHGHAAERIHNELKAISKSYSHKTG